MIYLQKFSAMLYTKDENVYAQLKIIMRQIRHFLMSNSYLNLKHYFSCSNTFSSFVHYIAKFFFVVNHYVFSDPSRYIVDR